ncbi:MAG: PP2C family protein-serine/threonine phosphatase [Beutenbergiaceae bacterium]
MPSNDDSPVRFGTATDPGGRRSVNEDAVLAQRPVFCVADGMGGHSRGDMASAKVVGAFAELADRVGRSGSTAISPESVQATIGLAQQRIRDALGLGGPEEAGNLTAGSTLAGVVLRQEHDRWGWLAFNVGDSRIYRLCDGALHQISEDHSVVQSLLDAGEIDEAQARVHPLRNLITRTVGSGGDTQADFWLLTASPGERLLLCSDGLTEELDDDAIAALLSVPEPPEQVAASLIARATEGGASDNVSAVVIDVLANAAPRMDASLPVGEYHPVDMMPDDTVPREQPRDHQPQHTSS